MSRNLKPSALAVHPHFARRVRPSRTFRTFFAGLVFGAVLCTGTFADEPLKSSAPITAQQLESAISAPAPAQPRFANFREEAASPDARQLAHWIVQSGDNGALPFIVVDKTNAKVFVFDANGELRGASAALLGSAIGDHTVPGIGEKKLAAIKPHERTTAAGRFVAYLDKDIHGEEVLWVDYDSALSLHRVVKGTPKDRRAERLASPTPADNRITYGCINVPVAFYENVVSPMFKNQGIVYVMPETRPLQMVFNAIPLEGGMQQAVLPVAPLKAPATLVK